MLTRKLNLLNTVVALMLLMPGGMPLTANAQRLAPIVPQQTIQPETPPATTAIEGVGSVAANATVVAAGWYHTCAVVSGGGVKCWGDNGAGQLGDGMTTNSTTPVDVSGLTTGVTAVAAGDSHTCALMMSGGVKCWGGNWAGQLGDGTTTNHSIPIDVIGLPSGIVAITTGGAHTCALTMSNGAKCWGSNHSGQLGDGTTTNHSTPTDVAGLTEGIVALSARSAHTCALTTGGGVKCWGQNSYGQLGDGTNTHRYTPTNVFGLTNGVVAVTTGGFHTCALTTGGGVKCWGSNDSGQLGDGTWITLRDIPTDVVGLTSGGVAITTGGYHTCALVAGNEIKCWGRNGFGQLGNGTTDNYSSPINVVGLTNAAVVITAGGNHTCALTTGGVKCWGYNFYGQLGNGTTSDRWTPVDVAGLGLDLGFRPNPNGYQFPNFGGVTPSDFTIEDMRQMFGDAAVCVEVVNSTCRPKQSAVAWNTQVNQLMSGGHCDGFTTTSLRFFKGLDSLTTFQSNANVTHDLQQSNARRHIAYYWALQVPDPVASARDQTLAKTPSQILDQLNSVLSGSAPDPTTLIVYNANRTSGHSITPYALTDLGNGVWWARVYDNNWPDDAARHVVITTSTDTWSYDLGGGIGTWSGDANTHSLGAIPISVYAQPPVCPWCGNTGNAPTLNATSAQIWYEGQGHLLITDSQGRRSGYLNNQFVNEIPGAIGSAPVGGLGVLQEPIYSLPLTDTYTLLLDGQTLTQTTRVAVTQFGPGYAVSVNGVTLGQASQDELVFSSNGTQLAFTPSSSKEITLTLALDSAGQSHAFQVAGADIGASQVITLTANTNSGQLVLDNSHDSGGIYDLKITRVDSSGEQIFLHRGIPVLASDTHYLTYGTWNGVDSMTLLVDHDSNDSIDQTIPLSNQVSQLYLPLIFR